MNALKKYKHIMLADRQQIEQLYWGKKLAEAEAEEKAGGRNRLFRFCPRDV